MPRRLLALLLSTSIVVGAAPAAAFAGEVDEEPVVGELQRLAVELRDGSGFEMAVVVPDDGPAVRVEADALDEVLTGAVVEVRTGEVTEHNQSALAPDGAAVAEVTVLELPEAPGAVSLAPEGAELAPQLSGPRTVHLLTATLTGQASDGVGTADLAAAMAGVSSYWSDSTAGAVSFLAGTQKAAGTFPWSSVEGCSSDQILDVLDWTAVQAGVSPTVGTRRHTVTYTPYFGGCGFAGVANVSDGGSAWINGVEASGRVDVIAHELGHTLTLGHSDARLACRGGADGTAAECRAGSYGDAYDVMGVAIGGPGPLSGAQLAVLGLLGPTSSVTADGPAEVILQPVAGLTGTRFLRFTSGGVTYVVEYRAAVGRDADLATSRRGCPTGASTCTRQRYVPGVVVHRLDSLALNTRTALLDVGALDPGHVWSEPRFTLQVGQGFTTADGRTTVFVDSQAGGGVLVRLTPEADPRLYVPVGPIRLHDRRGGVAAGTPTCVPVTGAVTGIPADATGVALNVATVQPAGVGHVVVYPDSDGTGMTPAPATATVNFDPWRDVANAALVEVPASGRICYLIRGARSGIVIDVTGYTRPGSGITLQMPQRLEDRRGVVPNQPVTVQVTEHAGVPDGATAVLLNVAGAGSRAPGNLRLWAAGTPRPATSTLNYSPAGDKSNAAVVQLSDSGQLTYESQTGGGNDVRVVLDVVGYTVDGSAFVPVGPTRLLDTRASGALAAGQRTGVVVSSAVGVPESARAVVLNVAGVSPTSVGNLRVFPFRTGSTAVPSASTLNYIPGADVANMVIAGIGDARTVSLYTDQPAGARTHVVVDVVGYLTDVPETIAPTCGADVTG